MIFGICRYAVAVTIVEMGKKMLFGICRYAVAATIAEMGKKNVIWHLQICNGSYHSRNGKKKCYLASADMQ